VTAGARDRGSASIWLLAAAAVVVAVGMAATLVGTATVARHRAKAAADLGALAGARYAASGAAFACARAAAVVALNGARLLDCHLESLDLIVTAEVPIAGLPGAMTSAEATSRAGPVRATGVLATVGQPGEHRVEHPDGRVIGALGDPGPVGAR
jgi:secretion/DNA translocation related TadE-like protein